MFDTIVLLCLALVDLLLERLIYVQAVLGLPPLVIGASFCYNRFALELLDNTKDLVANAGVKVGLSTSTHVPNRDDNFASDGGADDFVDGELSGTGYTGGFGGAGRKALASKTYTEDDANDRAEFDAADLTWTAINAGTVAQANILDETGASDDTGTEVVANIDTGGFPVVTNGGDLTIAWNAEGIIQLRTS